MICAYNLSTWEADVEGSPRVLGQSGYVVSTRLARAAKQDINHIKQMEKKILQLYLSLLQFFQSME